MEMDDAIGDVPLGRALLASWQKDGLCAGCEHNAKEILPSLVASAVPCTLRSSRRARATGVVARHVAHDKVRHLGEVLLRGAITFEGGAAEPSLCTP